MLTAIRFAYEREYEAERYFEFGYFGRRPFCKTMAAEEKEGGKYDNYDSCSGYEGDRRPYRYPAKAGWDVCE